MLHKRRKKHAHYMRCIAHHTARGVNICAQNPRRSTTAHATTRGGHIFSKVEHYLIALEHGRECVPNMPKSICRLIWSCASDKYKIQTRTRARYVRTCTYICIFYLYVRHSLYARQLFDNHISTRERTIDRSGVRKASCAHKSWSRVTRR